MGKTDRTKLSLSEAKRLARKFVQSEKGRLLPIMSAKSDCMPHWVITFDPANGDGIDYEDFGIIVVVDKDTAQCEFFWTL